MDIRVIGVQSLVDRQSRPEREEGLEAAALRVHVDGPQKFLQCAPVLVDRFPVALQAAAGKRPEVLVIQLDVQPGNLVTEALQRELQPVAPLAEAGVGLREHPGDAVDVREIYLAGGAAEFAVIKFKWCLVAARTREIAQQLLHLTHAALYITAREPAAGLASQSNSKLLPGSHSSRSSPIDIRAGCCDDFSRRGSLRSALLLRNTSPAARPSIPAR
jgi:hypothetical protein